MSYMALIIYNIDSFLFIIVSIVYSIIYLLILYVGIGLIKDNNSYKLLLLIYRCFDTCDNASIKLIMFVHTKFCKQ